MRLLWALTLLIAFSLSGCADLTHFNRSVPLAEDSSSGASAVFVDAKQRAIIVANGTNSTTGAAWRRFCAEPSPDALSALAANGGLNLDVSGRGTLGYNEAFAEGAASIGLRTQSIQILRDIMYRNCEAFLNQGVTGFGLETMQRRFQSTLVAVLAIEQLTGATKAQQVSLGGQSQSNNAEVLSSAIKLVAEAEGAAKAADTQLDAAMTSNKTAQDAFTAYKKDHSSDTTSDDYNNAKSKADKAAQDLAAAQETAASRHADLDAAKAVRAAATTAGGSSSVTAAILADTARTGAAANGDVSQAVAQIVRDTLQLGFGRELCTTALGRLVEGIDNTRQAETITAKFLEKCVDYLSADVESAQIYNKILQQDANARTALATFPLEVLKLVANKRLTAKQAGELIANVTRNSIINEPGSSQSRPTPMEPKSRQKGTIWDLPPQNLVRPVR